MAQQCEICRRQPRTGHRISHAHNLTPRRWFLNLHTLRIATPSGTRRARVCSRCLRSGRVRKASRPLRTART